MQFEYVTFMLQDSHITLTISHLHYACSHSDTSLIRNTYVSYLRNKLTELQIFSSWLVCDLRKSARRYCIQPTSSVLSTRPYRMWCEDDFSHLVKYGTMASWETLTVLSTPECLKHKAPVLESSRGAKYWFFNDATKWFH